jgi:hypothetical protein
VCKFGVVEESNGLELKQTSIDDEKREHRKLIVHYFDRICARKYLKTKSMKCVISNKTVDYAPEASYIPTDPL